jgi:hypothetical protein
VIASTQLSISTSTHQIQITLSSKETCMASTTTYFFDFLIKSYFSWSV